MCSEKTVADFNTVSKDIEVVSFLGTFLLWLIFVRN